MTGAMPAGGHGGIARVEAAGCHAAARQVAVRGLPVGVLGAAFGSAVVAVSVAAGVAVRRCRVARAREQDRREIVAGYARLRRDRPAWASYLAEVEGWAVLDWQ
jgi:hypothetical protein